MENIYDNNILRGNLLKKLNLKSYDQLNKAKFAESIGVQHDAIKKLTSGATQNPGIKTIVAMAQGLGCSIDELVGYKVQNKTDSALLSNTLEFSKTLFDTTLIHIFLYIEKEGLNPSMGQILNAFDNIYDYSFRRNLSEPDSNFADWIINSTFKS
jgi:transcriptional regulator with XRE-family HTH domain